MNVLVLLMQSLSPPRPVLFPGRGDYLAQEPVAMPRLPVPPIAVPPVAVPPMSASALRGILHAPTGIARAPTHGHYA